MKLLSTIRVVSAVSALALATPAFAAEWPSWIDQVTFENTEYKTAMPMMADEMVEEVTVDEMAEDMGFEAVDTEEAVPTLISAPVTSYGNFRFKAILEGTGGRARLQRYRTRVLGQEVQPVYVEPVKGEEEEGYMHEHENGYLHEHTGAMPYVPSADLTEWPEWIGR